MYPDIYTADETPIYTFPLTTAFRMDDDVKLRMHLDCVSALKSVLSGSSSEIVASFSSIATCKRCEGSYCGGFDPVKREIVICENHGLSKDEIRHTLRHECVHALDHANGTDFANPSERAMSEIRASRFSGECDLVSELRRWPISRWYEMYKSRDGDRSCVRRRSVASVRMALRDERPDSSSSDLQARAASVVDAVFDEAYLDGVES